MFKLEARKLLLYQRGWILLLAALLLRLAATILWSPSIDPAIEAYKDDYLTMLAPFEGALTDEHKDGIEKLSTRMNDAEMENDRLLSDFFAGKINESTFRMQTRENNELLNKKPAFNLLFLQYAVAREAPESRYLLYTNGWQSLFQHNPYDFILYFALLLLLAPIFLQESKSDMWDLLLTTNAGERRTVLAKLALAFTLTLGLLSAAFLFDLSIATIRYGLPHASFPFQSIPLFRSSSRTLTLVQATGVLLGLRLVGGLWLASLILVLANATRRYSVTLMGAASLLTIPLLLATYNQNAYLFGPVGLLLGTPILRGDESRSISYDFDSLGHVFTEWSNSILIVLLSIALFMSLGLSIYLVLNRSNRWRKNQHLKTRKPTRIPFALLVISLASLSISCSSITNYEERTDTAVFNSHSAKAYAWRDYRIFVDHNSDSPGYLRLLNVKTDEQTALLRLPLLKENQEFETNFFAHDHLLYLLFREGETGKSDRPSMLVYELNLETFELRPIFQKRFISAFELSLGLPPGNIDINDIEQYGSIYNFFIYRDKLYYDDSTYRQIKSLDLRNGQIAYVADRNAGSYSFQDGRLYTTDSASQVVWLDLNSGDKGSLEGVYATSFIVDGDQLFYQNRLDDLRLYAYSLSRRESWPISEENVLAGFHVSQDHIYFESTVQGQIHLYVASKDGASQRLCLEEGEYNWFYAFRGAEGLLYATESEGVLEWCWFE